MKDFLLGFAILLIFSSPVWGLVVIGHFFGHKIAQIGLITLALIATAAVLIEVSVSIEKYFTNK